MIPVFQTAFVAEWDGVSEDQVGNCLSACIASILELPIDEVPTFAAREDWFSAMESWLRDRGLGIVVWHEVDQPHPWYASEGIYGVASGKSPRGDYQHAVVVEVRGGVVEVAHDPNPRGGGIEPPASDITFLVPLGAAR